MWPDGLGEMHRMLNRMCAARRYAPPRTAAHRIPPARRAAAARRSEFQASCTKMPKALREYEAFVELKRTIDDFL